MIHSDSHVPEYQTLSERVTSILNNSEHPFGEEFEKFTGYVRQQCQNILEGKESSRGSQRQKKNSNGYVLVENDGTLQEEFLTPLEKLCEEIRVHSDRTAQLLVEHFSSVAGRTLKCKLQLCYEENFYNKIGSSIMKVYEMAHKKRKEKLVRDLERLSTYPIKCLDLGMKDEWWLKLFETRRQVTVAKQRSLSNPIPFGSGIGTTLDADSCTPPGSDTSSTGSTFSRSSHASSRDHECGRASPNDRSCTQATPKDKRRSSTLGRFISVIRRKSQEVSEAKSIDSRISKDNKCYDNYDSYKANRMSGEIEACNGTCTNNNKEACIPNGTDWDGITTKKASPNPSLTSLPEEDKTVVNGSKETTPECENELSKFVKYFGPSLDCLKGVFEVPSVFGKVKNLTQSLTKVTDAVQELRQQVLSKVDKNDDFSLAITADDLLPLMVLIILQMDSSDAAAIVVELKMMQDLIPKFLNFGCHGWALVEFDMAGKVLQSLCSQFDWDASFSPSS